MTMHAIKIDRLGKRYRLAQGRPREGYRTLRDSIVSAVGSPFRKKASPEEFWAIDDVSFGVKPGEIVGIIGRNGAGKSTLLKLLSRITKPTRGRIEINGRVGSLLEVGTGFHPELTGRDNVYLNGSILGMSRREVKAKFDEIVAFAEVEKFLDTPVKRYSSGMYVRLAFAVAAHLEPEILIVDEVLAVGDAGFQKKCLGTMSGFARSGRTVILVSHNLAVVEQLCTRAVLIQNGRVLGDGGANEIIGRYVRMRSDSPARGTNQKAAGNRVVRAFTASKSGEPLDTFTVGETIGIHVEISVDQAINSPWIGIQIRNEMEVLVSHIASREAGVDLRRLIGDETLVCTVPDCRLLPGQYYVTAILADYSNTRHDVAESICQFTIRPTAFAKSGMPMTAEYGIVSLDSEWNLT